MTQAQEPGASRGTQIDRREAIHGAAHAAALIHYGLMFESITTWSDGLCEIQLPHWGDDAAVNARIALAGPCVGLFEDILVLDGDLPSEQIIGGSLVTWAEDFSNPNHGYSSDLATARGQVEAEAETAYAFVLSNLDLIEQIADEFVKAGGQLPYAVAARLARGKTSAPTEEALEDAMMVFAGQSVPLQKVDDAIREHLESHRYSS